MRILVSSIIVSLSSSAWAEPTRELSISGPTEVLPGDPETASVDAQGRITMGPQAVELARTGERPIVALVAAGGGTIFAGTAGGGLIEINSAGKTKQHLPDEKLVVSALLFERGTLYAATSPDGKIVALREGKVSPFFDPAGKYVWAMVPNGKGGLYVATGQPGRVIDVMSGGKSEVLLDPGETHVRALIAHPKLGLIAGGGQKGVVYRLEGKKSHALYDSGMEETTAFAIDPASGDLYAAFVSESKPGTLEPDKWIGPVKGDVPAEEDAPIKGSEVVRIKPSGAVDLIWSSKTEGALGLAFDQKTSRVYIATAAGKKGRGRIYAFDPKNRDRLLLIARLEPPMATTLMNAPAQGALIAGTAPSGRVVRIGPGVRQRSAWVSSEQDLRRISTIGRIWFDADVPPGAKVQISLRSGNTKERDDTWSEWSAAVTSPEGGAIEVPRGRYVQIRAELAASPKGEAPLVKSLHASVVRLNEPPEVREVFLLRRGVYMSAMPAEEEKEKTVTLNASVMRDLRQPFETNEERVRVRQGVRPGMMTVAWGASDPNDDQLLYRVEIRSVDRAEPFTIVADDVKHEFYSFDSRAHPDGKYQFRITASDRPSNPPKEALIDRNLSEPFFIDNAPPKIAGLKAVSAQRGRVRIEAQAEDDVSALGAAEFSVSGGPWLMLPASDGLIDARSEKLSADLQGNDGVGSPKIEKGRQTVLIRVEDEAGNSATASTFLDVR
jgi:hypothetical protein